MKKYKSYKRIHTYKHESDIEKGKIAKEKHGVSKQRKNQDKVLAKIIQSGDQLDENLLEDFHESLHAEKKESGNLKAHKQRLKTLIKEDSID